MLCWRRMEKISWTEHARNEEVLQRVTDDMDIVHIIKRKMTTWIGHILCRNCLLKQVILKDRSDGKKRKKT